MLYFLSAGEASGDLHASQLMRALRMADEHARFCFLGGDLMAAEGGRNPVVHYRDMAYMGFADVVRHLPDVTRNLRLATALLARLRPDALILVDYPGFNLRLASRAYGMGIPVYYYISPKVWAWKEHRIADLRRYCRKVLSILPFEPEYFRNHGMEVDYVGNPSREEVDERLATLPSAEAFRRTHNLATDRPILALVPGSRMSEIRGNLPIMAEAVRPLMRKYQAVVAALPGIDAEIYERLSPGMPRVEGDTLALMANATAALVTSGTATLECALAGTPQVVCYRHNGSRLTYEVMSRVLHIDAVSLPNLIAGRSIVPEMLLHRCTPLNILGQLLKLLPGQEGRRIQLEGYEAMRKALGNKPAAATAANIIISDLCPIKN